MKKPQMRPNPRLQRTRSRAPLSRKPFGGRKPPRLSMRRQLVTVLLVVGTLMARPAGGGASYSKAVVYFEGWNVMTRAALSPDQVRKVAPTVITVTESKRIAALLALLKLNDLKSRPPDPVDARLVIDFFGPEGKRISYHASRFDLVSEDRESGRPIDEKFRRQFEKPGAW